MKTRSAEMVRTVGWEQQLELARSVTKKAALAIRPDFGQRHITERRGPYDVQLRADVTAQTIIVKQLLRDFPSYGIVAEEGMQEDWNQAHNIWVVDPLDGTNNFGYGIAHCAVAITLFAEDEVVLAVVRDVLLDREFYCTTDQSFRSPRPVCSSVERATVSLVTDYSAEGRSSGQILTRILSDNCKRVVSMWAPSLDLALVAEGALDAMVCLNASLLDLCSGIFLVQSAGGHVLDTDGMSLQISRRRHAAPLSFVAARSRPLAEKLLKLVSPLSGE
jgi:myo-inositol-1(or 4)-monophosphatase